MDFFFNGEGFVFDFESCNMWIRQSQGTQSSGQRVAGIGGGGGGSSPGAAAPCPTPAPVTLFCSNASKPVACSPRLEGFHCDFTIFHLPRG